MTAHRLLVVEDDRATSAAVAGIFRRMGWQVRTAATVVEGLASLADGPAPCCLILDLDLPDGPGETVLGAARRMGLPSRVVVTTGSMDGARLATVASLRPDLFLTKPVTLADLWAGPCRVCESPD